MRKFRTQFDSVEEIDVTGETNLCVIIDNRRVKKRSSFKCYFDSRREAIDYLITQQTGNVAHAQSRLDYENEKLRKLVAKFKAEIDPIAP